MTQVGIDTPHAGMFCVHTFCVVAVAVFVACSRSFILLNIFAHVRISFAHTTQRGRSLVIGHNSPCRSIVCRPHRHTRSTALRNTCIYAQVRLSWRFGLAPFIAYSGTHTSHTRCHTCYLCIRIRPFRSYSALIHSQAHTLIRAHVPRGVVRSCRSICQGSLRFGVPFVLVAGIFAGIAPK